MEILPPRFECSNGFVLREGPLFRSTVRIHTKRNSKVILFF